MMKMRIGVVNAVVFAAVQSVFAIDPSGVTLTVEKGSPTTIDSAVTYDSVTLHDNLTVDGATVQLSDNAGKDIVSIGATEGDDVTLRLTNGGRWVQTAGKGGHVKIGGASKGGFGRIIVEGAAAGGAKDTFRMRDIIVDGGAAVPQDKGNGENTVLYLGPGAAFWTHGIQNWRNNSSIRIQFAGGSLNSTDGGGAQWFANSTGGNCTTVVESVSQSTILFDNQGHSEKDLTNGKGTFIFEGAGNIQFTPGNGKNTKIYGSAENYDWSNFSGNMVLAYSGSRLLVTGVNVLPCGAKPGILMSSQATSFMDIQADNAINGIETAGQIVNEASGASVATLTVGQYKDSSVKAGSVSSRIAFKQVGQTINLAVAKVPSYQLAGGTLKISANTAFEALSLSAGSTLVVDGCKVTADLMGYSNSGATITCLNGGTFEILCDADSDTGAYVSSVRGFKKTGRGTFTANERTAITSGLLHVAEGGLVLSGIGTMKEWWRVTITRAYGGWYAMVGCLGLFAEGGHQPVTDGMTFTYAGADVAAEALAAGQTTFSTATSKYWGNGVVSQPSNGHSTKWAASTEVLLSSSGESACTFQSLTDSGISESSPAVVTFRMAQKAPVSGFSARVPWNSNDVAHKSRHISNWLVETSADGMAWTTVLDMRSRDPLPALVDEEDVWGRWYGGNGVTEEVTDKTSPDFEKCLKPYALDIAAGEKVLHAKGLGSDVTVRVDRGAMLDCTMVEGGQEISRLEVDLSGGTGVGTLKGVKMSESGTLNLLGNKSLASGELPLEFEESETTGDLSGWTVTVNGKQANRSLVWENGRLCVRAPGMMLIIR